jgi:hypothetical protein
MAQPLPALMSTRFPGGTEQQANSHRKGHVIQLGDSEIEEIIAKGLTRGQIVKRYGVGEHAAQLARTTAVAIARERRRLLQPVAAPQAGLDLNELRTEAEAWIESRQGADGPRLGTDRSKIELFLHWLGQRHRGF